MFKKVIKTILRECGYELKRLETTRPNKDACSEISNSDVSVTDIEMLAMKGESIPGMIEVSSGKMLYILSYMQQTPGDVVEIGSWQGRSSMFLARAVRDSNNGQFFAVDHFMGNLGKENHYKINGSIDNLKEGFLGNMELHNLKSVVNLLNMSTEDAVHHFMQGQIRFLFIDGDHTYKGVRRDIELFFPRLASGAIVVFDDYFEHFPELINAIDDALLNEKLCSKVFYYRHTLVVEVA